MNTASGTVNVAAGNVLAFSSAWSNSGLVTLQGAGAVLNGGTITNSGTIQGAGTIGASVINSAGVIWAVGGELDLAGAGNTNPAGGQIQIDPGAKLRYLQGLATNDGFINLTGGTFDNNNQPLSNAVTGIINGYGTLRTGGLTSTGALNVGGGDLNVLGNFTNNGTVSIQSGRTAYFYGNVNGAGSYTGPGTAYYLAGFSPGNSPASVSFGGNVTLASSATLDIELGGTTSGTQYDQVHVTSQLTLGGALDVTLINGFTPALSEKFDILDWGIAQRAIFERVAARTGQSTGLEYQPILYNRSDFGHRQRLFAWRHQSRWQSHDGRHSGIDGGAFGFECLSIVESRSERNPATAVAGRRREWRWPSTTPTFKR